MGILMLALVLIAGLSACDSSDSNDDDNGEAPPQTISMSIGGSEVELNAFFASGTDPETGEDAFLIYLTEASDLSGGTGFQSGDAFGVIGRSSSRPGTGTYSIADVTLENSNELLRDQFAFVYFEGIGTQNQRFVLSNGGDLEITTSSSSRVAGSFEIDGASITFGNTGFTEEDVTIEGSFDASNAPFFIPDDVSIN
jgi:hypothetical protein